MSGSIFGTVKDPSGNLLTNAVVSCPNLTVTNSSGSYVAITTTGGTYTITASCTGFVSQSPGVTVTTGQNKQKNFVLQPV